MKPGELEGQDDTAGSESRLDYWANAERRRGEQSLLVASTREAPTISIDEHAQRSEVLKVLRAASAAFDLSTANFASPFFVVVFFDAASGAGATDSSVCAPW
jgi:hypothetical protein